MRHGISVHTDVSYLSKPSGKSRAAGHFYLSNCNEKDFKNGAILTLSTIIKHIMLSASKAELAVHNFGCKLAAPLQTTLEELGHVQPTPNPVTTNNITAHGLTMGTMTPKASKPMDQCFHWLKCSHAQHQFQYLWQNGILNCANYSSKHHAPKHHQNVCSLRHKCLIPSSHVSLANPSISKSRWSSANCQLTSWLFPVHGDTARDIEAFFKIQPSTWHATGRHSRSHILNFQPIQSSQQVP
jgi:hypothetical protein